MYGYVDDFSCEIFMRVIKVMKCECCVLCYRNLHLIL